MTLAANESLFIKHSDWDDFFAVMLNMLTKIERDRPVAIRKTPVKLVAEVGKLWKLRENAVMGDPNGINTQMRIANIGGAWV